MNHNTKWASVKEAQQYILSDICAVEDTISLPLAECLMHVLAEDVLAPFNVPGYDNSAMDGFACRAADMKPDLPVTLSVIGTSTAGHPYNGELCDGECLKIMTGAKLPVGAELIVPQEETTAEENTDEKITIQPDAKRCTGQHVRLAGEDMRTGSIAVSAGTLCYPAHIGLLASIGKETVKVYRQLRVAFFSTGDEVRATHQKLKEGEVYDSNRHTLRAMIQRLGFIPIDLGIVPDDRDQLITAIDSAVATADVIVTSGGASVGEADHIRNVLAERGEVRFWRVAMRPGRPLAYGKVGAVDFFGLPGNPVSVMVCFYQFVREALWKRAGRCGDTSLPLMQAATTTVLRKSKGRTEFQRGLFAYDSNGNNIVTVTGDQGSGILSSMVQANCFIVLSADCERKQAGDMVTIQPFEALI